MSSFLDICQRTARELEIPGDGPSSVVDQVGQHAQIVRWVNTAIRRIERRQSKWKFMWANISVATVLNQQDYALAADWGITEYRRVDPASLQYFQISDGVAFEQPFFRITWEEWTEFYSLAYSETDANVPSMMVELPNGGIWRFINKSDDLYTLTFDYYRGVQDMFSATDPDAASNEPYIPEDYEDMIVGAAMMAYGRQYEAQDKLADGQDMFKAAQTDIMIEELPKLEMADALA